MNFLWTLIGSENLQRLTQLLLSYPEDKKLRLFFVCSIKYVITSVLEQKLYNKANEITIGGNA